MINFLTVTPVDGAQGVDAQIDTMNMAQQAIADAAAAWAAYSTQHP